VHALYQRYWDAYARARATIAPMSEAEVASYSESRMKHLREYG
jgi:hypothetical protein